MSQAEVKERIRVRLEETNDQDILAGVLELLSGDEEYIITEEQAAMILEGDRQIEAGHFLTNEQAEQQWRDLLAE